MSRRSDPLQENRYPTVFRKGVDHHGVRARDVAWKRGSRDRWSEQYVHLQVQSLRWDTTLTYDPFLVGVS